MKEMQLVKAMIDLQLEGKTTIKALWCELTGGEINEQFFPQSKPMDIVNALDYIFDNLIDAKDTNMLEFLNGEKASLLRQAEGERDAHFDGAMKEVRRRQYVIWDSIDWSLIKAKL